MINTDIELELRVKFYLHDRAVAIGEPGESQLPAAADVGWRDTFKGVQLEGHLSAIHTDKVVAASAQGFVVEQLNHYAPIIK